MPDRGQRAQMPRDRNRLNRGADQNRRCPDRGGAPARRAAADLSRLDLPCLALRVTAGGCRGVGRRSMSRARPPRRTAVDGLR